MFWNSCEHDWEVVTDKTIESAAEQMGVGKRRGTVKNARPWTFRKKSITILQCSKCGELDKTIEEFKPSGSPY